MLSLGVCFTFLWKRSWTYTREHNCGSRGKKTKKTGTGKNRDKQPKNNRNREKTINRKPRKKIYERNNQETKKIETETLAISSWLCYRLGPHIKSLLNIITVLQQDYLSSLVEYSTARPLLYLVCFKLPTVLGLT